jgi:hypothetical protein
MRSFSDGLNQADFFQRKTRSAAFSIYIGWRLQNGEPLEEQLVSVVIDNVTGKHYKRVPKRIMVEEEGDKPKVLRCLPFEKSGSR